jgi:hypothetical protein
MHMRQLLSSVALAAVVGASSFAADTQFKGHCAMSAAKGSLVPTDCSIYWISPEDKLYCFVSVEARDKFVAQAPRNEKLADAFWRDPAFWEQLNEQQ